MSVVVPGTGELLDLSKETDGSIVDKVRTLTDVRNEIDRFNRAARTELAERMLRTNDKTWHVDDLTVSLKPIEKRWDIDKLALVLDEFVQKGVISQEAAERVISYEPHISAREVNKLLDNPRTAPEVSLCYELSTAPRTVQVK